MSTILTGIVTAVSDNVVRPIQNLFDRAPSMEEADSRLMDNLSRKIRVCLPCKVVSYDAEKQTIVAQPLIQEKIRDRTTGADKWVSLPQLLDVPVMFPQGGSLVMTFPVKPGDEVMVMFADSSIDAWWFSGGIQKWVDRRRHDLSDGIAVLGINSIPNVIPNIATDAAEIRTKDGNVKVSVKQVVTIVDDIEVKTNSLKVQADGSSMSMAKQTLVSNGIPALWDNAIYESGSANITLGKTNVDVPLPGGGTVQVPTDTISLNATRILKNGTDL